MNSGVSYSLFYDILLNLRGYYHSYGRIDDSNAKLDEITKLIAISYSMAKKGKKLDIAYVRTIAENMQDKSFGIASSIRYIFEEESKDKMFLNSDGTNIFGANASLNIQPTEDDLAEKIISEIEKIDFLNLIKSKKYQDFDIINECFGHFVRENFRNNKAYAQYMTPYEISEPMLEILFNDMAKDGYFTKETLENFVIMDPTCGVGTLLIESSNHFTRFLEKNYKQYASSLISRFRTNGIVGQDKVDRMVRLSKINALLLGSNISNINIGNSITGESSIDKYSSRADVIFTNPPFGAEHEIGLLNLEKYPILQKLNIAEGSVNSELLMLDRCIGLLKDNGYLVIVLPDSVFASKGMNSLYRDEILKTMQVRGVIELPSVTFAQAGTRTNTCIFYLQKKKPLQTSKFFMASCKELGYVVKEKMGVPVKISKGQNQMEIIARALVHDNKKNTIVSETPSITNISKEDLTDNILKPGFYSAERIQTIEKLSNTSSDIEIKKLSELVDFVTKSRKGFMVSDKIKHISVLHINPDCTINFDEVEQFEPISKGRSCQDGDLIFSKLNPSIPRMAIVPKKEYSMVCSNEFEIMRTKGEIDAYTLCFLLRTENVQNQIEHLTSGTSSSHSRIKQEQLAEIMIPVPKSKQKMLEYKQANEQIKKSIDMIYEAKNNIKKQLKLLSGI
ncbi:N-6 DNA methylase [Anthropogastromicrobium sp.]|uniref:N-6 DNA methylase n=1 Tax=Anthropogastromicrobium sp. TaxID=2981649 RepID=UPI00307B654D